jgi:hypothetical protein
VGLKRLSRAVTFKLQLSKVLSPTDPLTVPVLRLLMGVDDVRRAQILLVEADQRLDVVPAPEKYLALGDWLYSMRLVFSHLHEAGAAVRSLDRIGKERVDALLAGNDEAVAALEAVRRFFNAADYKESLIAKVRDSIGFHYQHREVGALVEAKSADDWRIEATAAEVGGLARMADSLVLTFLHRFTGGGVMTQEQRATLLAQVASLAGHFITFVDHLFDALVQQYPDAVVEQREVLLEIPPLLQRARAQTKITD